MRRGRAGYILGGGLVLSGCGAVGGGGGVGGGYSRFGGRISPPVYVRSLGPPVFPRGPGPDSSPSEASDAPLFRPRPPPIQPIRMEMGGKEMRLECHNLSYIRSFTTGAWYSKLFNPPITAQFLKDVNLEVRGGEVMGIIGASGSGKTTLLNVIARRVQGTTGGSILLNHRPITEQTFQKSCAYVSFRQPLLAWLNVKDSLSYQAALSARVFCHLSCVFGLRTKEGRGGVVQTGPGERAQRVAEIMRDMDLADQSSRNVSDLKEPARRRLILALHLIRDPVKCDAVLILVDDPTRDLDPLSGYQFMHCLFQYTKRYNRMAIVGTAEPRSDIYQLFERMTILFFGEVVYSGYTKRMPGYFRSLGYPCPVSENPAIFYLALATVDRETSERYLETQDTAVHLIELWKTQAGHLLAAQRPPQPPPPSGPFPLPLSSLGRPPAPVRLAALLRRAYYGLWRRRCDELPARLLALPLLAALLLFYNWGATARLGRGPADAALDARLAASHTALMATAFTAALATAVSMLGLRRRFHQERWDGLYGGTLFLLAHFLAWLPFDVMTVASTSAILHFGLFAAPPDLVAWDGVFGWLLFTGILLCVWLFATAMTLLLLFFIKDGFMALTGSVLLLSAMAIPYTGYLKSYETFLKTPGSPTDWIYYISHASIFRYAGLLLTFQHLNNITNACSRGSGSARQFCRWESGREALEEVWGENAVGSLAAGTLTSTLWPNLALCGAAAMIAYAAAFLAYSVPMPHILKRKFRYK